MTGYRVYTHNSPNMAWCFIVYSPATDEHFKVPKRPTGWAERTPYRGAIYNCREVAADQVAGVLARCGVPALVTP
jgi:hypothetical protein